MHVDMIQMVMIIQVQQYHRHLLGILDLLDLFVVVYLHQQLMLLAKPLRRKVKKKNQFIFRSKEMANCSNTYLKHSLNS